MFAASLSLPKLFHCCWLLKKSPDIVEQNYLYEYIFYKAIGETTYTPAVHKVKQFPLPSHTVVCKVKL